MAIFFNIVFFFPCFFVLKVEEKSGYCRVMLMLKISKQRLCFYMLNCDLNCDLKVIIISWGHHHDLSCQHDLNIALGLHESIFMVNSFYRNCSHDLEIHQYSNLFATFCREGASLKTEIYK